LKLSGRTYLQSTKDGARTYHHTPSLGLENTYFGQSPLVVDLNGDGRQDLLWLNIDGPVRAFLNTAPGNYVTIVVPDTVANIGTTITIETTRGRSYTRTVVGTVGMLTDQTPELSFGLGPHEQVLRAVIQRPNGETEIISAPPINRKTRIN
jgi:enediyne biosynthesis protein E4